MILEPEILKSYREQFEVQFRQQNLDEAVLAAQNISSGRIAQILTDSDYELIIPFLEIAGQKQAGEILSHLPAERSSVGAEQNARGVMQVNSKPNIK